MTTGLLFDGLHDANQFIELAQEAEALGVDSAWVAEQPGHRDAATIASALLAQTEKLCGVPGVISPYSRHPMTIAMSAGALHELFPGRVGLLVGTGGASNQRAYGVDVVKPVSTLRETISALRSLLRGETLTNNGGHLRFEGAKLGVAPAEVPIYMAAIGPQMQRTAGRYADGIVFSAGHSPKFIEESAGRALAAQRQSNRREAPFTVVGFVVASVAEERQEAYRAARDLLSYMFSSPFKAADWELNAIRVDHEAIHKARSRGDAERARALISDQMIETFTASGTPQEFQARIRSYRWAGLDALVLAPLGAKPAQRRAIQLAVGAG